MTCTVYSCQQPRARGRRPQPRAKGRGIAWTEERATKERTTREGDGAKAPGGERLEKKQLEKKQLTRAAVVGRAVKLADANGLDALTIRKLAQELGVTPMALYWHFRSKEELLEGLAEHVWSEVDLTIDPADPWQEQLRGLFWSLIGVLRAHPSAPWLLSEYKGQNEHALRAMEVALGVLRGGAGFGPSQASEIARLALWNGIMLVLSENGFDPGSSLAEREEAFRLKAVAFSMLPPATYPLIVEHAKELTDCGTSDLHYRIGADIFIAGVEAAAARSDYRE